MEVPSVTQNDLNCKCSRLLHKVYAISRISDSPVSRYLWCSTMLFAKDCSLCAERTSKVGLDGSFESIKSLRLSSAPREDSNDLKLSRMTCAFAPAIPKQFTLALSGMLSGQGSVSVGTTRLFASNLMLGLPLSKKTFGGMALCSSATMHLSTELRPDAPSACPRFGLMLPMNTFLTPPKTCAIAFVSIGSPTGVPVPWAYVYDLVSLFIYTGLPRMGQRHSKMEKMSYHKVATLDAELSNGSFSRSRRRKGRNVPR
jgi:hypothetical protein